MINCGGVGGYKSVLQALREIIGWPVQYCDEGAWLGVAWPRGALLLGPSGCGKTLMVQQVARECGAVLHNVTPNSVCGSYVGESERLLREVFAAAQADADAGKVAAIFLDELDSLAPKRTPQGGGVEARVVGQLLTLIDQVVLGGRSLLSSGTALNGVTSAPPGFVVVLAASSAPNRIDPALRRPGRLDREITVGMPTLQDRHAILSVLTASCPVQGPIESLLEDLARRTRGFSGADLAALVREAGLSAVARDDRMLDLGVRATCRAQLASDSSHASAGMANSCSTAAADSAEASETIVVSDVASALAAMSIASDPRERSVAAAPSSMEAGDDAADAICPSLALPQGLICAADFEHALRVVKPSSVRGAAVEVEPVQWEELGGLHSVKREVQHAVEWPLRHPEAFARLSIRSPRGVLLYGPPGCSKTTLARAVATSSRCPILPLSSSSLYSMYLGEGESLLRERFQQARRAAPAIVFLDEVDALAGNRDGAQQSSGTSSLRLLTTLLTEMDGLEGAEGVLVLAATNRPWVLDAALLRPGRFDVLLYVPPPDLPGRVEVLQVATEGMPLCQDINLTALAESTELFTGAELKALVQEAAMLALRQGDTVIVERHLLSALCNMQPAVTPDFLLQYEQWSNRNVGTGHLQ